MACTVLIDPPLELIEPTVIFEKSVWYSILKIPGRLWMTFGKIQWRLIRFKICLLPRVFSEGYW